VTVQGKPLVEAGVCTLEVVLRNTATYTIGFLLVPKYKPYQIQRIEKASSWMVIGYFPFPDNTDDPIRMVENCVTDQKKITDLLLANKVRSGKEATATATATSTPDDDSFNKSSPSVVVSKRTCDIVLRNQNKRRNIEQSECKNEMAEKKMEFYPSATSSPVSPSSESLKKEAMTDDDDDSWIERKTMKDELPEEPVNCACDDVKKDADYYIPFQFDGLDDEDVFDFVDDRDLKLFSGTCSTDFLNPPSQQISSPKLLYADIPTFFGAPDPLFAQPFFFNAPTSTSGDCDNCSFFRSDSSMNTSFPWLG